MKALKGRITISKTRCSDGTKYISIEIGDSDSGCSIVTAIISLENFADTLTGLADQQCDLEYYSQENIGKKTEYKEELISYNDKVAYYSLSDEEKQNILKPFEVDGWKGNIRDLGNYHRKDKTGYRVRFMRYI